MNPIVKILKKIKESPLARIVIGLTAMLLPSKTLGHQLLKNLPRALDLVKFQKLATTESLGIDGIKGLCKSYGESFKVDPSLLWAMIQVEFHSKFPNDIEKEILRIANTMSGLLNKWSGNIEYALIAYAWGSDRLRKLSKTPGDSDSKRMLLPNDVSHYLSLIKSQFNWSLS